MLSEMRGSDIEGGGHDWAIVAATELSVVERIYFEDFLLHRWWQNVSSCTGEEKVIYMAIYVK